MSYTIKELQSIFDNQSEYEDYNNFILNFDEDDYRRDLEIKNETDPTDPKKAKGDTKKDTKVDPKSTVSSSDLGSLASLRFDTSKPFEQLKAEALERKKGTPITADDLAETAVKQDATKIEAPKRIPGDKLSDEYIERRKKVRTVARAVLTGNKPYQLGIDGMSITELNNTGELSSSIRPEVEDLFLKMYQNQDLKLPSGYDIDVIINQEINREAEKERKDIDKELDEEIKSYKSRGDYKNVIAKGFEAQSKELSNEELNLAQYIQRSNKLRKELNNTDLYERRLEIEQELNELKSLSKKSLSILDEDLTFAYDPATGDRLNSDEIEENPKAEDWSSDIKKLKNDYKELSLEKLEQRYFKHALDYSDNLEDQNKTIDLKLSSLDDFDFLRSYLLQKGYNSEEGIFKDIKYKDLIAFQEYNPDFIKGEDLQKAVYLDPSKGDVVVPSISEELSYISKERNNLIKQREAFKTAYLLNIDPASIDQSAGDVGMRFLETVAEGTIGDPLTRRIGTSKRKELDDLESLLVGSGIELTEKQKENFERSGGMKVVEGVGYFVPELGKFAIANKFAGAAGVTNRIRVLLQSPLKRDKLVGHAANALLEEVKFEAVTGGEAKTLSGAGFYAGGQISRFIPKFKGSSARFNSLIEKTGGGFIGGVGGAETAKLAESLYEDLNGSKSFKSSMKEYYGDMDEATERIIIDGIVFSLLGVQKIKSKDFKSIAKRREIRDDLNIRIEKGDFTGRTLEKKKSLVSELNRDLNIADREFNNLDIGSQREQRDQAQAALNKGNLNKSQERQAKDVIKKFQSNSESAVRQINRQFNRVVESGILGDKVNLEIIEGKPGGDKANYDPISNTFKFDILQYKPGVLAQEVGHSFMSAAFEQNKEVAETFKKNILDVVNKSFKGITFNAGGKNNLTFEEAINESYDIAKQRPEEYVMNIVEFLSDPKYKNLLLEKGFLKGLKRQAVNAASKIGIGQSVEKNLNTGADVMEFLFSVNEVAEKGTSKGIRKKFDQFKNLLIDGDKLIDIQTGSEVVSEKQAEKEMASVKIEESEKKDIFTKANKAYEELKDTSPSDAGLMVGMEFQPIVEKKVRSYLKAKDLQVPEYVIEDIVADVSFGVGKGSSSIPTKVMAYDKVQKLIKYIKQSNPSEADISAKAKELNVRSDAAERAVAFAKGDKAEASMTSYVFGQLNNSILASFQKPEYRDMFKTVSFDADPTKTQNIAESEGLGGGGFVDTSSPVVYTRVSQKKAETQLKLKETYIAKAKEVGEKVLKFVKLDNLDAMFVGTLKTNEGKEVFAALLPNDKARVTVDGVTEIVNARNPKALEQRYGAPEKSFKKSPTTKDQIVEFAKDMLLPELEKEAGDLKDNYTTTEKYSSFVDRAFPLFKSYISQSAVNKRMREFKEPVIDPATGKPAREKTAAGRGIFKKKDITLAEWRKYYIGDGKKRIDGRRRSLLEAIATEQGFDKVMETLGDKALKEQVESRQEDLNVDLLDNYVAVIAKSLDRNNPNVMASKVIEAVKKAGGKIEEAFYLTQKGILTTSEELIKTKSGLAAYRAIEVLAQESVNKQKIEIENQDTYNLKTSEILDKRNVPDANSYRGIKPSFNKKPSVTNEQYSDILFAIKKIASGLDKKFFSLTKEEKMTKGNYMGVILAEMSAFTSRGRLSNGDLLNRAMYIKDTFNIVGKNKDLISEETKALLNEAYDLAVKNNYNNETNGISIGLASVKYQKKAAEIQLNKKLTPEEKIKLLNELPEKSKFLVDQDVKSKFLKGYLNLASDVSVGLNEIELKKFVRGFATQLKNNDGAGIRKYSLESIFQIDGEIGKEGVKNEHLKAKAQFAADVIESLLDKSLTSEKIDTITKDFISAFGSKEGQEKTDKIIGATIPNAAEIKMILSSSGANNLSNVNVKDLNNYYNVVEGKRQYDVELARFVEKSIKFELKPDKSLGGGFKSTLGSNIKSPVTSEMSSKAITLDEAIKKSKDPNKKVRGISVFDFDDTLARTKSNVLYTLPNGKKGKINATEFAAKSKALEKAGAKFDFSEFSKVVKGELGPLFAEAQKKAGKFTTKDIFVLTARPATSAPAIQEFLKSQGLNIPLNNITGLADGRAQAKADWITKKVSEGYNDFYFADDAIKNVEAVKQALDLFDVKSDVQQAIMASKDIKLDNELAKMIERKKGISSERPISASLASNIGRKKGKFDLFLPPNAEDFAGLMYKLYGKGKQGDADMAFIKEKLLDPYNAGEQAISTYKQNLSQDYKSIEKQLANIKGGISPKTKATLEELNFNADQAVRVALWNQAGYEVPGISNLEAAKLRMAVIKDKRLKAYADGVKSIIKGDMFEPSNTWYSSNIRYDLFTYATEGVRSKFLEEWNGNIEAMFTPENYSRMEAAYGSNYVKNLKQLVARMKSGKTRPLNLGKEGNAALDYINGSVGVTMWINTRSAVLQTISAVNYTNWGDNNPLRIARTLANPKNFAKTFVDIFNSDFLKQRRSGLELNVEEAEIAKAVERSRGKASSIYNYLIKAGFKPTQIADSFAIASGGTPFLINRTKTYEKQGLEFKEAREKAFKDLRELSEENQQSSRMDRVSNIQTGILGRMVFAFNNTPMQMTRLQKKAALDLVNRRGDFKTNISKLVYYAFVQQAIFYSLQQATSLFMFGGDDEDLSDTEKDRIEKYNNKKVNQILNSMLDSFLAGSGMPGKVLATGKNTIKSYLKETEKGYKADYANTVNEALSISPTLSTKTKKAYSAFKTFKYYSTEKGKKELENYSKFGPLNPVNMARAKIFSATTNVPVDRMLKKIENVEAAFNNENTGPITRLALLSGWDKWSLGFYDDMYVTKLDLEEQEQQKEENKKKAIKSRKDISSMKREYKSTFNDLIIAENIIINLTNYSKDDKNYNSAVKKQEDIILKIYKKQDSIKDFMFNKNYKLEGNKFVKIK